MLYLQSQFLCSCCTQVPLLCKSSYMTSVESLLCHQTLRRVRRDQTLQDRDCLTLNSTQISNLPLPSLNNLGSLLSAVCKSLLPVSW